MTTMVATITELPVQSLSGTLYGDTRYYEPGYSLLCQV